MTILLTATNVKADPVFVEKGEKAPYTGLLFTEETAKNIRNDLIEKDALTKINSVLRESIKDYQNIEKMRREQIDLLSADNKRLNAQVDRSERSNLIWLGLGVLLTGAAVYGASSLSD